MLFEDRKREWKIVSDFFSEKYDDDIVEEFIEKINATDRSSGKEIPSSPMEREIFAAVEAKIFVDHVCTKMASSAGKAGEGDGGKLSILYLFRNNSAMLEKFHEYYLHTHAALLKQYGYDKEDCGLNTLDREDFTRVLDILMSYIMLK